MYSQFWLILLVDDRQFGYIRILKKKTVYLMGSQWPSLEIL